MHGKRPLVARLGTAWKHLLSLKRFCGVSPPSAAETDSEFVSIVAQAPERNTFAATLVHQKKFRGTYE